MSDESLLNLDWLRVFDRLGDAQALERGARESKAFLRPRDVASAPDMLRLILSYCLSAMSLRPTVAWAGAVELANISNVGLIYHLRQSTTWLEALVAKALQAVSPPSTQGRPIAVL